MTTALSPNKTTVQRYMDAFARSDHAAGLACLTDTVEWDVPGAFLITGKDAFDREIENAAFVDGGMLNAVFCDVFVMKDATIRT